MSLCYPWGQTHYWRQLEHNATQTRHIVAEWRYFQSSLPGVLGKHPPEPLSENRLWCGYCSTRPSGCWKASLHTVSVGVEWRCRHLRCQWFQVAREGWNRNAPDYAAEVANKSAFDCNFYLTITLVPRLCLNCFWMLFCFGCLFRTINRICLQSNNV